jgi:hypothetical protein
MDTLKNTFQDRYAEILAYLDLLENIEMAIQAGIPRIGGENGATISAQQQKILKSGVYLQLYNLIESTVTNCLDAVSRTAITAVSRLPSDLSNELRREWVKYVAKTNVDQGAEKRLSNAIVLCEHLVNSLPIASFEIEKGGGGNWDDDQISKVAKRIGCNITISNALYRKIKRPLRDDMGPLSLVVNLRNNLAHGSLSFAECGQYDTVANLRWLSETIGSYLQEVVRHFEEYIREQKYLRAEVRSTTPLDRRDAAQ